MHWKQETNADKTRQPVDYQQQNRLQYVRNARGTGICKTDGNPLRHISSMLDATNGQYFSDTIYLYYSPYIIVILVGDSCIMKKVD